MISLLDKIINHIFGRRYWCVTIERILYSDPNPAEHGPRSVSNYIFRTSEDARAYYYRMKTNRMYRSVEIITFRSRNVYAPHDNGWAA